MSDNSQTPMTRRRLKSGSFRFDRQAALDTSIWRFIKIKNFPTELPKLIILPGGLLCLEVF